MVSRFRKNKKIHPPKFRKAKFRRASPKRDIFFSILLGALLVLVIGFLIVTNIKINRQRTELTDRIATLKQEIGILEGKREELKEKISQAGSEEYLEEVARDQLDMKAPGEEVIVITKGDEEDKEEEEKEKRGWWEWIKSRF